MKNTVMLILISLAMASCAQSTDSQHRLKPYTYDKLTEYCVNGVVYYFGSFGMFAPKYSPGASIPDIC